VHPDVILLERGLYQPEQIGRRSPETQDLSIDQVRTLVLSRAAFPPHEGRARVIVIRRAEELSTGAANALLKTLEEPGERTHFILMSARAESLLATVRSRTQRLRFGRLPGSVVERLLIEGGTARDQAAMIAKLAHGSMAEAAAMADPDAIRQRDAFVSSAMAALEGRGLGSVLEVSEDAKKQKGALPPHLLALAQALADAAAADVHAGRGGVTAANRYQLVLGAVGQLRGNAAAQLVAESLLIRMRGA
jgi:DNA polymerase-3 subunit delta'